ncbi:MAG TPA: formate dehydrogenase accessory sulfurtransferase FdhD [Thermoanaerobaculia bacterium]|nr:formate dehydrogenase accessory sulfurtransferase FdhD [Thermoanaerobaculia bacterium]
MPEERIASIAVTRVARDSVIRNNDVLAVEEPLEIRVAFEEREKNISVTMRTPGDDFDLAAGFLFTEGLIRSATDIDSIRHWGSPNVVRVALRVPLDSSRLDRHFYTTSSCGVCGKTSIDAIRVPGVAPTVVPVRPSQELVHRLPQLLQQHQSAFQATGGLHGAALFTIDGALLRIREDIGRHNAVDKVLGSLFRDGATPLRDSVMMVSSRASFELVQKAIVAGVPAMATVGAPSTLAVELAREFSLTLLGFVREGRFNIYSGDVTS